MTTNAEFAMYLRDLADAIGGCDVELNLIGNTFMKGCFGKDAAEQMGAVVRGFGGRFEKRDNEKYYELVREFGPFKFLVYSNHENVCEKVTTFEQVEVTKWVCPPSILQLTEEEA